MIGLGLPNELDLTFQVPNYGAEFHQNRVRIVTVQERSQTQMSHAVQYNNGTDNQNESGNRQYRLCGREGKERGMGNT